MTLISSAIDYDKYPVLEGKSTAFKSLIEEFAVELRNLSSEQKKRLGLFKAIELTNATVQTLEKERAPESLGKSKALTLFNIVRSAIRTRCINLPDGTEISLKDDKLKRLIDRACVMFHAGKNDPEQKAKAVAFSMAQNIVLEPEIQEGFAKFSYYYPTLCSLEIRKAVDKKYSLYCGNL